VLGALTASGLLLVAFVLWQRVAKNPLLPLSVVLDRNRGAAYSSIFIAGVGVFGVFLFVTYYLQVSLKFDPIATGLAFLPMIGVLVLASQLSTNIFVPRFGPKILVPVGMLSASLGLVLLTRLQLSSTYAADVLPGLLFLGLGIGLIMPASIQTATLGVDKRVAGVASALVNTSQQVGGSIGTSLLNTLAATAAAGYVASHLPATAAVQAQGAVASYTVAYWVSAGFFAIGAVLAALLFRRHGSVAPVVVSAGVRSSAPEADPR